MLDNLTFNVIAVLVMGFIISHLGLIIASRWLNPIALIAGAYFLLSPISAAVEFAFVGVVKYGRVYATLLLLFVAFFVIRLYRIRATAASFLLFVGVYVIAGVWSELPLPALKYKGLYFMAVLSGFMLAYSIRDFRDLEMSLRILAVAAGLFAALILFEFIRNPGALVRNNRLAMWDMNPNRIGQTLAPMLILLAYLALYDASVVWRRLAYVVGSILGIMLIFTGSRGSAGAALVGCFIVSIPKFREPVSIFVLGSLVAITVVIAFKTAEIDAPDRLLNPNLDNRQGVWTEGITLFKESPFFGKGWVYNVRGNEYATANMHSLYLQTIVEAGIFGGIFMVMALTYVVYSGRRMLRTIRDFGVRVPVAYLAVGYVVAILVHGFIEAGTTRGSTLNGLMLPFALGLFDRIPEMLRGEGVWGEQIEHFDAEAYDDALDLPEEAEG